MASQTLTASIALTAARSAQGASFWDTLASEWVKLTSLRFTQITLSLGLGISLATAAIASVAMGSTQSEWPASLHPATFSMIGNIFSLIIYSVFGVMVMAGEYSSGMMRLTLTATPRRGRVFLAKLMLVSLIVLVFGLITTLGMFFITKEVLGAYGMHLAGLGDANTRQIVIGLGVSMPFFPIMGLALGVILRNTAGAITTVLALLWLPQVFGQVLPMWWRENVLSLLPQSGMDSLTLRHLENSPVFSEPTTAVIIVATWLVVIVGASYVTFVRRDV